MATQIKLRRGTTAQNNAFTGAEGEVTVDTDKDTLVVHNGIAAGGFPLAKAGANSDITSITGLGAGTALLPTITPTGDTNTGVWFPAADTVAVSTGGSERMRVDSGGNVGIGTASPVSILDVKTTAPVITANSSAFAGDGNGTGFGAYRSSSARLSGYSWTIATVNESGGGGGEYQTDSMTFNIRPSVTSGVLSEAMRIDGGGNVLVTSPAGLGYGTGSGGTVTQATDKGTAVTLNKPTGQITMNGAALLPTTAVAFLVNNTLISATDTIVVSIKDSVASNTNYQASISQVVAGAFVICLQNISAGSLSDALIINFAIIKGATS